MPRRRQQVTIWEAPDGRAEFWPIDGFSGRWTVLMPSHARLISDEHRGILVDDDSASYQMAADVLSLARIPAFGFTIVDGWGEDAPAPKSPPRPPISPIDCKHHGSLMIEHSTGGPPHRSHTVSVCPRCGRFSVSGDDEEHRFRVEFELATAASVRAAGRYHHYLSLEG